MLKQHTSPREQAVTAVFVLTGKSHDRLVPTLALDEVVADRMEVLNRAK